MPQAAFTTLGCKVNQVETETLEGLFKQRGYDIVAFDQVADVYVINTCSVTHLGERKSRQIIRRAIRLNPKATVVVTGCYAQIAPKQLEAIPGVAVIVGTQERHRIVELAEEAIRCQHTVNAVTNIMAAEQFEDIPLLEAPGRTRAFLKIQEGCTNFCTYCIIPYARGPLRSRPLDSIARETEKFLTAGFKEIVLTGIHLGAYGRDMDGEVTLDDAVKTILAMQGLERLRLSSLESIEVSAELIRLMQQDLRLCPHLHLPLQAGDNQVLHSMKRHYNTDDYRQLIRQIRNSVPDIAISTDIIVGFPGETPDMFENALGFVKEMNFAKMHIFPYSRRSGTPAAEYPGQIPETEKKQRVARMQLLAAQKSIEFQEKFIDRQLFVLFEAEKDGIVDGLTGNYLRVYGTGDQTLLGELRPVKLEKLYRDGLWGTVI
ncbi:MAG TPA: tRNA (N(6)-L-threonylcarbamoyladenosine(37)-C(2))-methylthiotransferase MtaB [Negativicutes bacterium]